MVQPVYDLYRSNEEIASLINQIKNQTP